MKRTGDEPPQLPKKRIVVKNDSAVDAILAKYRNAPANPPPPAPFVRQLRPRNPSAESGFRPKSYSLFVGSKGRTDPKRQTRSQTSAAAAKAPASAAKASAPKAPTRSPEPKATSSVPKSSTPAPKQVPPVAIAFQTKFSAEVHSKLKSVEAVAQPTASSVLSRLGEQSNPASVALSSPPKPIPQQEPAPPPEPKPIPQQEEPVPIIRPAAVKPAAHKPFSLLEKYSPKRLNQVIGQQKPLAELAKWIADFKARKPGVEPGVLITGPPGIGKTTIAHLFFAEHGYRVAEMNSSEERTRAAVVDRLLPLMCSNSSKFFSGRGTAVVLDEIDGMTGEAGGLGAVVTMLQGDFNKFTVDQAKSGSAAPAAKPSTTKLKEYKLRSVEPAAKPSKPKGRRVAGKPIPVSHTPVICIANAAYSKKLVPLKAVCREIKFSPPTLAHQRELIERVLQSEGYQCESGVSLYIAKRLNSADMRHILTELGELLRHRKQDNKLITDAEAMAMSFGQVDVDSSSPFGAATRLLRGGLNLEDSMVALSVDPGKIPNMLTQNYPDFLPCPLQRQSAEQLKQAQAGIAELMARQADLYSTSDAQGYGQHGQVTATYGTSVLASGSPIPGTLRQNSQSLAPLEWREFGIARAQQSLRQLPLKLRTSIPSHELGMLRFRLPTQEHWANTQESKTHVKEVLAFTNHYGLSFANVQALDSATELEKGKGNERKVVLSGKGKNGLKKLMQLADEATAEEMEALIEEENSEEYLPDPIE